MLNKVILIGRITNALELKKTENDISVIAFGIAIKRRFKDAAGEYPTDFINIVAWRSLAEFISQYFDKGQLIAIVGSIQTRTYTDREGIKRTVFEVVADEAHFVESKKTTQQISSEVETDDILPF
nr:MAG TPA: Single strand binding protein [Caudoviricetes sp.]